MYMDDEEGLAFLEISEPRTMCEYLVQRFSWHKDHVATYIDDEGAWTGGMRFVPGDPTFFAFPMFVAASLTDAAASLADAAASLADAAASLADAAASLVDAV